MLKDRDSERVMGADLISWPGRTFSCFVLPFFCKLDLCAGVCLFREFTDSVVFFLIFIFLFITSSKSTGNIF